MRGGHIQSRLPSVSSRISPIRGPGSEVGHEIEPTCREPIVGGAGESASACNQNASPVPSGGSPDGTGQWPVPPFSNRPVIFIEIRILH